MLYLSVRSNHHATAINNGQLGVMTSPDINYNVATIPIWAADNGCYAAGDRFNLTRYLTWLEKWAPHAHRCLFATAPDVVGDATATRTRSLPVLPQITDLGYRAAYVLQDGETTIPDTAQAIFIGGTTKWKLSPHAAQLTTQARARGLWTHMGRVNSATRLNYAAAIGCQSADGTLLAFNPHAPITKWATQPVQGVLL